MAWLDTQTVECTLMFDQEYLQFLYVLSTYIQFFSIPKIDSTIFGARRRYNSHLLHFSIILCNTNMLRKNSCQNLLPKSDTTSSRSRIERQIELRTQPYVMTEFRNFQRKKAIGCIVCAFRLQMTRRFFWQQIFHRRNLNIWQISPYAGLAE